MPLITHSMIPSIIENSSFSRPISKKIKAKLLREEAKKRGIPAVGKVVISKK